MTTLKPYGSMEQARNISKVGKLKTPGSLVERMPSAEVVAKVGDNTAAARNEMRRVVRRNA